MLVKWSAKLKVIFSRLVGNLAGTMLCGLYKRRSIWVSLSLSSRLAVLSGYAVDALQLVGGAARTCRMLFAASDLGGSTSIARGAKLQSLLLVGFAHPGC